MPACCYVNLIHAFVAMLIKPSSGKTIIKITKESYYIITGLNLNGISFFTNNHFVLKGN
jgi:hypothetical protein